MATIASKTRADRVTTADRVADNRVVELLERAYWMELETAANYLAASVNLDGIRARAVADALDADLGEEVEHARKLARRLHELDATVPGSLAFIAEQRGLQPVADSTDVEHVVRGVLEAEEAAIEHYRDLIEETDGLDWVTHDLAVGLLADEESHRRLFRGFLREYDGG